MKKNLPQNGVTPASRRCLYELPAHTTPGVVMVVTVFLGLACFPAFPQAPSMPLTADRADPDAIAALKVGRTTIANAAWWGFDSRDATEQIQSAIDSGAATVVIPYVGMDWIVRPIRLASRQDIIFEPGVVVVAKKGEFRGIRDCLFIGEEVEQVTLSGYGAFLRMRRAEYRERPYEKSEWRHALALFGAKDVTIQGLQIERSGGDGIYLGPTHDQRRIPCRRIRIDGVSCVENYRQGISVVAAENLRIENCVIRGTRGSPPQAGIDFEPANERDPMVDIEVRNCRVIDNDGSGLLVSLGRQTGRSPPISIRIMRTLVRGSRQPGFRLLLKTDRRPRGVVEFVDCTCEDIEYAGVLCAWNAAAPISLRFLNCNWRNVARRRTEAPIVLDLWNAAPKTGSGAIEFVGCTVFDDRNRPFVRRIGKDAGVKTSAVRGEITLVNPNAGKMSPTSAKLLEGLTVRYRKTPG